MRPIGAHRTAVVGSPPEHRDWQVGDCFYLPVFGDAVLINAFCTVDGGLEQPTRVGARSFLMAHVHVGHDAQIGADCEIAPHVTVCGHVEIGDRVRVGANACIRPYVKVGDDARIGMGAVVTRDVPAGETWVGNPAEEIEAARRRRAYTDDRTIWEQYWADRAAEVPCAS